MKTHAALVLLGVVGSVLGCTSYAQEDKTELQKAILAIQEAGGEVEFDEKQPGKPVVGIIIGRPVPEATLELLPHFRSLRSLALGFTHIGDKGLHHISGLTTL